MLGLLVYGYATGVFSSRKLERATYDSVAFRFIAANDHPDHDTIATFRRWFLKEIEGLFVQVLALAREMGMLKMGTVALDGTKIHAKPSLQKHVLNVGNANRTIGELFDHHARSMPEPWFQRTFLGRRWRMRRVARTKVGPICLDRVVMWPLHSLTRGFCLK